MRAVKRSIYLAGVEQGEGLWELQPHYEKLKMLKMQSKAMFTWDQTGTVLNRTGPDQLLLIHRTVLEPVRNRSKWIQNWTCKKAGPVLEPFRTSSRTAPCKQNAYPIRFLDRIHLELVSCKLNLSALFHNPCFQIFWCNILPETQ